MIDYTKMHEIASFLSKEQDAVYWEKLADIAQSGEIYLTFWGQFSAGKSKLINNIVGRNILPVKRTETTAVLTYIRFADNEGCQIRYSDGRTEDKDLEYALSLTQQSKPDDVNYIEYLTLTVHDSMQFGNLVLVDTPGINTLHQRHLQLAEEAVRQSGKLFYVLSGPVNKVDQEAIEVIARDGLNILFVRTHCDDFNESEENVSDSLQKEHEVLENIAAQRIEFFPVSNIDTSPWYKKISTLRNRICEIAANLDQERHNTIEMRCRAVGKRYTVDLEELSSNINELLQGNCTKLNSEISTCQKKIEKLSQTAENREIALRNQMQNLEKDAQIEIQDVCDASKKRFKALIGNEPDTQTTVEIIPNLFEKEFKKTIVYIQNLLAEKLSAILKNAYDDIYQDFTALERPDPPSYEEIRQENTAIIDQTRAKLITVKKNLQDLKESMQNSKNEMNAFPKTTDEEYERMLNELDQALEQIPVDTPTRLEEKEDGVSDFFAKIGELADWALLLLPGGAISAGIKGIAKATKLPKLIQKLGKVGNIIFKAGNIAAKNANILDKTRDCIYSFDMIDKIKSKYFVDRAAEAAGDAYEKMKIKKKAGEQTLFDYISAKYWFKKLGENFDDPPKVLIDHEEEERRNQLRREIYEKKRRIVDQKVEEMRQARLFKNKEAELTFRQKEIENSKTEIEKELNKQEHDLKLQTIKASVIRYKNNYSCYFQDMIDKFSQKIINDYLERAKQDLNLYVERENLALIVSLSEKKEQLDNLIKSKDNGDAELKNQLSFCKDYIKSLQEYY